METIYAGVKPVETGERIRNLMEQNGYTVRDLQNAMGFQYPQAVYKWLNGETIPKVDNLIILAIVFHVKLDDILVYDGDFCCCFYYRDFCRKSRFLYEFETGCGILKK